MTSEASVASTSEVATTSTSVVTTLAPRSPEDRPTDALALTELYETTGNPDSETVVVVVQGGPAIELFSVTHEVAEVLHMIDLTETQLVTVHQVQTLDPERFTTADLTFEQTQAATVDTITHLSDVIYHFLANKKVYVVGISYGAFVVQELLATQGNVADGYLISVGRVDMPEEVWRVFSRGEAAGFVDGTEIVEFSIDEAGMDAETPAGDRNMARLAASLGRHRYSERLATTPLTNVVYVYGSADQQVGRLTEPEIAFLKAQGAEVIGYTGGHETPDSVTAGALDRVLNETRLAIADS